MSRSLLNADLPDDILVQDIARLPLVEQVRIGRTSPRFHRLMTLALGLVDSLTVVLETGHYPMDYWFSETLCPDMGRYVKLDGVAECERDALLGFKRIDKKTTLRFSSEEQVNLGWLATSMPNVSKLMFAQDGGNWNVNQLVTLLNAWSSTLVSLTLLCHPYPIIQDSMTTEDSNRLFGSINSLVRLQDLFMEFTHRFESARLDLPILGQLRRFHFYSADRSNQLLLTSLQQYAPNNQELRQILLGKGSYQLVEDFWPDYLNLDRRIASKVTALYNGQEKSEQDGPKIDLLCSKFTSLTYLKLTVVSPVYTPAQLVKALSRLNQLYYLDLDLSGATKMKISAQAANSDSNARPGGPRLASVQVLVVNYGESYNHRDLSHMLDWSFTFPGLRVVEVNEKGFRECNRCRVQKLSRGQAIKPGFCQVRHRPSKCIRKMTSTFRHCPLIRKLMLYNLEYQDSKDSDGCIKHLICKHIRYH